MTGAAASPRLLLRRPFGLGLVLFFGIFVLPCRVLFSRPEGLGVPVSADSPSPLRRWLHDRAVACCIALNLPWLCVPRLLALRADPASRPAVRACATRRHASR